MQPTEEKNHQNKEVEINSGNIKSKSQAGVTIASVPLVASKNNPNFKPIKKKIDWRFLWMAIVTGVAFVAFAGYLLYVNNIAPLIFAGSTAKASPVKSMVFAYPLTIDKAVGESSVQVFLISEEGKPIPNKVVALTTSLGNVVPATTTTDENGTAVFTFTSSEGGVAELTPYADNQKLAQSVTVKVNDQ
ncbi:MAG: Ig-like domain-containing protein [Patescibacteria group bacterium]